MTSSSGDNPAATRPASLLDLRLPSRQEFLTWLKFFGAPLLIGILLRVHELSSQILLDDEWHSLNFVIGKSLWAMVSTQGLGANCIPQNIYHWILIHSLGWSEFLLRLPSVTLGIVGLVIFPSLIAKMFTQRAGVIFAYLLAIAPCPVFYARLCRPYSMVMFFGFLAVLALVRWLRTGGASGQILFSGAAFLAVYYHLYSGVPLLIPLVLLFGVSIAQHYLGMKIAGVALPRPPAFILAGVTTGILILIFIVPPYLANPWWSKVLGTDHVTSAALGNYTMLLSGTNSRLCALIFVGLIIFGLRNLVRDDRTIGVMFTAIWLVFLCYLKLATQEGMHAAIQIARYSIIMFPIAMLLVALAIDRIVTETSPRVKVQEWGIVLPAMLLACLLWRSPFWETYQEPNNFTNHSAFQDSYAPMDWSMSRIRDLTPMPQMGKARIPAAYLKPEILDPAPGIIEYPMFIGDPLNLYYFYQHYHGRDVVGGYVPELRFPQLPSKDDFIYQDTSMDYVLSRGASLHPNKMSFTTLVPVTNMGLLHQRYRGWVIIVHKELFGEMFGKPTAEGGIYQPSAMLMQFLSKNIGRPALEDAQIAVWRIP